MLARTLALSALSAVTVAAWGQSRPEVLVTSPAQSRVIPMETTINGENQGTWTFLEQQGTLYVSREALDEWRVKTRPQAKSITLRGVEYWPLSAVPGFSAKTSFSTSAVDITFAGEAFEATKVSSQKSAAIALSPAMTSAFANYEVNYSASRARGGGATSDLGAIVEVGGSNELGVFTSSYVGRNLTGSSSNRPGWTRLETSFTRNMQQINRTLRFGDSGTRPGLWGNTVYFGGVQYGTNFALTPGFLTQPNPVLGGVSSSPSTVELYINDVLRQVSQVPAGPFAIDNATSLSGSGEARMVVRDILGREVVITQPFFVSASLLAKGLSDWGVEAGALRRDYGLASGHYGPGFASGTWRYGFSDSLTVEGRAQVTRSLLAAGFGLVTALPADTLGRATLVGSHATGGSGYHWMFGADKPWAHASLALQAEGSSQAFRTLEASTPLSRLVVAANASYSFPELGNFGFAIAYQHPWGRSKITTVSANYSRPVGSNGTVSANVSKAVGSGSGTSIGVTFNMQLEQNRQMTAAVNSSGGRIDAYATASQPTGSNGDFGWRVLGGRFGEAAHAEGGLYYRGRYGDLNSDLSVSPTDTALRLGLVGGMVFAGGNLFVGRRVDQSYALVELKDLPGVGVGIGTNFVTRTDSRGMALVPGLNPYSANQIRLNSDDLPLSAEIDSIERMVIPSLRTGVRVTFPVRSGRAALLKIQLDDGEPAPAGASVHIEGDKEEFWVARQGQAYVTGLQDANKLELTWKEQRCRMEITLPPAAKDAIARVGPVLCAGVKR